jgi:hypothetical protein
VVSGDTSAACQGLWYGPFQHILVPYWVVPWVGHAAGRLHGFQLLHHFLKHPVHVVTEATEGLAKPSDCVKWRVSV